MIDLSPEAGRLIKSMYEKIHSLMTENHYLRSQLLSRGTTVDLDSLVCSADGETEGREAILFEIEDISGPFMGLDMADLEPGGDDGVSDQVLRSLFAGVL